MSTAGTSGFAAGHNLGDPGNAGHQNRQSAAVGDYHNHLIMPGNVSKFLSDNFRRGPADAAVTSSKMIGPHEPGAGQNLLS